MSAISTKLFCLPQAFSTRDALADTFSTQTKPCERFSEPTAGGDSGRLPAKAAVRRPADCITFIEPMDEQEIIAIYRSAYVFTLVSDKGPGREEDIPLIPIAAIDGTRNGIMLSPRDLANLVEKLTTLLSETGHAQDARIAAARRVAEERFGYIDFIEKHRKFCADLRLEN